MSSAKRNTLLLVFLHGFKGTDHTFAHFPQDLRALLSHSLPKLDVLSVQYPQYDTRGDLKECVARFKEWLQNKVIDLEVANHTPSPTVEPSVHVVLCGHSMGGIVAAETLLSIARDEAVPANYEGGGAVNDTMNAGHDPPAASSGESRLFFPYVQAVLAFDTPFLGISPGVLAHGAEEQFNQASSAYKAFDTASSMFGWKTGSGATVPTEPIANAAAKALPAPNGSGWGKWAMYGGAAAAIAGAAGAAYLNWNQINDGLLWAGSHLEFVGCLAKSAELQKRVEGVVALTHSHGVGFADYYTALGDKITSKTKYAGAVLGDTRTFCVVPRALSELSSSPAGSKRDAPAPATSAPPPTKRRRGSVQEEEEAKRLKEGEQVQQYAKDPRKDKGSWVRCVNEMAPDELRAHTTMFTPSKNPGYHVMLPEVRDRVVEWVMADYTWYEQADEGQQSEDVEAGQAKESSAIPPEPEEATG